MKIIIMSLCLMLSNNSFGSAVVDYVKGNVSILAPGHHSANLVKSGDLIVEDTSVLTGDKSSIRIKYSDGSLLTVGPNSKVIINLLQNQQQPSVISLLLGKLRAKINKTEQVDGHTEKFVVKTRQASLGVRGTEFQISTNETTNSTSLVLIEGKVAFKKNNDEDIKQAIPSFKSEDIVVKEGEFSSIKESDVVVKNPIKINNEQFIEIKKTEDVYESPAIHYEMKGKNIIDFDKGEIVSDQIKSSTQSSDDASISKYEIYGTYKLKTINYQKENSLYKYAMDEYTIAGSILNYREYKLTIGLGFSKRQEILSITNPLQSVIGDDVSSGLNLNLNLDKNVTYNNYTFGYGFSVYKEGIIKQEGNKLVRSSLLYPKVNGLLGYSFKSIGFEIIPGLILSDSLHFNGKVRASILTNTSLKYIVEVNKNQEDSNNNAESISFGLAFGF